MFGLKNVSHMKNEGKSILRILATAVLGLIGFSSCGSFTGEEVVPMYGQPHADFKALGSVHDEKGNPIERIRVAIHLHKGKDSKFNYDTVYTDSKGAYLLERGYFAPPDGVTVTFEDVDGDKNGGEFESSTVSPAVQRTKDGDKLWYAGAFQVEADAVLRKK